MENVFFKKTMPYRVLINKINREVDIQNGCNDTIFKFRINDVQLKELQMISCSEFDSFRNYDTEIQCCLYDCNSDPTANMDCFNDYLWYLYTKRLTLLIKFVPRFMLRELPLEASVSIKKEEK